MKKTQVIITEICRQINEFRSVCHLSQDEIQDTLAGSISQLNMLKLRFESEIEVEEIRTNQTYKLNERNSIGLKTSEDWIYNLYIGNVMHLAPLG